MTASFHGHVDIVRMLTEAKAQVNTQEEVHVYTCILLLPPESTLHNTSSYVIDNDEIYTSTPQPEPHK